MEHQLIESLIEYYLGIQYVQITVYFYHNYRITVNELKNIINNEISDLVCDEKNKYYIHSLNMILDVLNQYDDEFVYYYIQD